MINLYPEAVANKNVPMDVYLIADISQMSGEIHTTYYINRNGEMFKVKDWVMCKPEKSTLSELCKLTGDSEMMINNRWSSYFYWKDKNEA